MKSQISRRQFMIATGVFMVTGPSLNAQQTHDFFGRPQTEHNFFGSGSQTQQRQITSAAQRHANTCGETKSSAMNQRTADSRPIMQQAYGGTAPIGSLEISIANATLYHITGQNIATAYPIGAGASSRTLIGKNLEIARKAPWPSWTPTENIARRLNIPQRRVEGGACNPMGAYALYLYFNGDDTIYRIHGTNDPESVGNPEASSGCIRMYNEDIMSLQTNINIGTPVNIYAGAVPGTANSFLDRLMINTTPRP